ncbi:hypothetical protein, unlikely [Trypanosoma brucei gambiense DAL972]|uniref:Uncharacterized protein n=1 Tax=Trypanosoma brucei gambiense (strain MHOM/CI/86/DAL972) TaxID=679716 RepID=C9ZRD1_TRYB9|nr:hypothetical protein, unlikely [Trypanosoma brucei gambiense DAL972]CBH11961.1 hypothetical protein, unlikely [Trypanosoma brucei gambiense DAL972]|eukprot:XP_011774246.1 hypothetical protein, unlikely [Trypanosoma brucei gambiense DAL972]
MCFPCTLNTPSVASRYFHLWSARVFKPSLSRGFPQEPPPRCFLISTGGGSPLRPLGPAVLVGWSGYHKFPVILLFQRQTTASMTLLLGDFTMLSPYPPPTKGFHDISINFTHPHPPSLGSPRPVAKE